MRGTLFGSKLISQGSRFSSTVPVNPVDQLQLWSCSERDGTRGAVGVAADVPTEKKARKKSLPGSQVSQSGYASVDMNDKRQDRDADKDPMQVCLILWYLAIRSWNLLASIQRTGYSVPARSKCIFVRAARRVFAICVGYFEPDCEISLCCKQYIKVYAFAQCRFFLHMQEIPTDAERTVARPGPPGAGTTELLLQGNSDFSGPPSDATRLISDLQSTKPSATSWRFTQDELVVLLSSFHHLFKRNRPPAVRSLHVRA